MSTPPLPILAISLDAYRILFRNFGVYLRLSWLPFLIIFAASTGMQFYYRDVAGSYDTATVWCTCWGRLSRERCGSSPFPLQPRGRDGCFWIPQ